MIKKKTSLYFFSYKNEGLDLSYRDDDFDVLRNKQMFPFQQEYKAWNQIPSFMSAAELSDQTYQMSKAAVLKQN